MKKVILTILGLSMWAGVVYAQPGATKKAPVDAYRNSQWKPEKGKYYFSHVLIYKYTNTVEGTEGELWIYIDPVTGTMCFQRESSFGTSDDMNESILALPNGKVITCGTTEAGKKIRETFQNRVVTPTPEEVRTQREVFGQQCRATGERRQVFDWPAAEYVLSFIKTNEQTTLWLADVPFNMYPLYAFDEWGGDAQLPVSLNYAYVLGPNQLVVESNDQYGTLKLLSYEPNPYFLDLNEYARQY